MESGEGIRRFDVLSVGLLVHMWLSNKRLIRNTQMLAGIKHDDILEELLYTQIKNALSSFESIIFLQETFTPASLYRITIELCKKRRNLSHELHSMLLAQPLLPPLYLDKTMEGLEGIRIQFTDAFLYKVKAYFQSLERNRLDVDSKSVYNEADKDDGENKDDGRKEEEKDKKDSDWEALLDTLEAIPRQECPSCHTQRILYCPTCAGLRMPSAIHALPQRIPSKYMPFDVLILLHYAETPQRSTGAQALTLLQEDCIQLVAWPKDLHSPQFTTLLQNIDVKRDIVLFPMEKALSIQQIDWAFHMDNNNDDGKKGDDGEDINVFQLRSKQQKRRVILLDSNWQKGEVMYRALCKGLQTYYDDLSVVLPAMQLTNIEGQYWRFAGDSFGTHAVSTIEALYHCTIQVIHSLSTYNNKHDENDTGKDEEEKDEDESICMWGKEAQEEARKLLLLFDLQRRRVERSIHMQKGYVPRGFKPSGSGISDWVPYLEHLPEGDDSCNID